MSTATAAAKKSGGTSQAEYKGLIAEAQKMMGRSGTMAHRRVALLVRIFEDQEFRDDVGAGDDFELAAHLDIYVEDLCHGFLKLRAMLERFPKEADWAEGKLASMYKTVLAEAEAATATQQAEHRSTGRARATVKDLEQARAEVQDAKAQLRYAQSQLSEVTTKLSSQSDTIGNLKMENERLKGRIEELERLLKREMAAA